MHSFAPTKCWSLWLSGEALVRKSPKNKNYMYILINAEKKIFSMIKLPQIYTHTHTMTENIDWVAIITHPTQQKQWHIGQRLYLTYCSFFICKISLNFVNTTNTFDFFFISLKLNTLFPFCFSRTSINKLQAMNDE